MEDVASSMTRRRLLAGASGLGASMLAGCSERLWSRAENSGPDRIELTIKTVPTDDDAIAAKIMSRLRENFREAGIDTTHEPMPEPELYRDVLIEGDYDVFVLRHPGFDEYDAIRGLLHSQFVNERGWQNPFHFTNVTADNYLQSQRTSTGSERRDHLSELFDFLEETAPYTVVAYPHQIGGVRRSLDAPRPPRRPLEYIDLLSREPADGSRDEPLTVGVYGEGLTERLNPLVVDRNRIHGVLELLYDPLARRTDEYRGGADEYVPWLAEDIEWEDSGRLRATITLRPDVAWHDGHSLDADDVAFTLRFLGDTSLGELEAGVPAPRYRGRQTLVENVAVLDERTVQLSFGSTARPAAARVLSIPLLPEHVWEPRSAVVAERRTEALVTNNEAPIGSGLFRFGDATATELVLEPFDDHVFRDRVAERPDILDGFSQFSGLRYRVDPNAGAMIDALRDGEIDITGSDVPPEMTDRIREVPGTSTITGPTSSFYMIGYNLHHPVLGNPHFRRILSRLIDREHVVSEFFGGFADPAATRNSLVGVRDDQWERAVDSRIATFPGSDGEIDTERVRTLFEEAGYRYDEDALLH
ncbi:ABC transporter substrate-binding protein [Halopiger djelfimassiliensis]|uniref:ABC transporter substrate-binding protein n=1 Tax=Halopiger djelfimassiliensis TaxID=1293047 RepID=UPI000677DFBA|nr:ABC transporter substrate-binding protein [Halopiger djelfimassiliensis]